MYFLKVGVATYTCISLYTVFLMILVLVIALNAQQ